MTKCGWCDEWTDKGRYCSKDCRRLAKNARRAKRRKGEEPVTLVPVQTGVATPGHSANALTPATIYHPSRRFGRSQEQEPVGSSTSRRMTPLAPRSAT